MTLVALGAAAALAFLAGLALPLPALAVAAKPLPVLILAWSQRDAPPGRPRALLTAGLVLSAVGDVVLELGHFVPGLVAFLCAHVAYVGGFLARSRTPALLRALPFAVWGGVALARLWPHLGPLAAPVSAYVLVICTMGWRAAALVGEAPPRQARLALAGAALFVLSDTILAFNKFADPIPGARWFVMSTYWAGQVGIGLSLRRLAEPSAAALSSR